MHAVSLTALVNPPGAAPVLTREQIWRGLVLKAEDARPFVPGMTRCAIVERRGPDAFLREVEYRGERIVEAITSTPPVQARFERAAGDPNAGWITNVVGEMDGELVLTFTFAVRFPGAAEGSLEEAREGERMAEIYREAVRNTLATARRLAGAGEL